MFAWGFWNSLKHLFFFGPVGAFGFIITHFGFSSWVVLPGWVGKKFYEVGDVVRSKTESLTEFLNGVGFVLNSVVKVEKSDEVSGDQLS